MDESPVAIKVGASPTSVERFAREAEALRRIGPPHTPAVRDRGSLEDGRPWIAMELLAGSTLADEIRARAEIPDLRTLGDIARSVVSAVAAAHRAGIVHRDVKPENIFLAERDGRMDVVLLDFGLMKEGEASADPSELTRTGAVLGTSPYMSPEQVRGGHIDARADVYALGVVLFELFTSRTPFVGDTSTVERAHVALRPPRPSLFAPVPPGVEGVILACLAKDPSRRPDDASELLSLLEEARWEIDPAVDSAEPRDASILSGGVQPVVLASIDTRAPMPAVIEVIARFRGTVVRQRRSRYIVIFSAKDSDRPANAAVAAAREITERLGGRADVRLANVSIRWTSGRMIATGPDLDRALSQTTEEPWSGVIVSEHVAKILIDATDRGDAPVRESAPAEVTRAPLIGREGVVRVLDESATSALRDRSPWLVTLVGDAGSGKSRLALEAEQIARAKGAREIFVSRSERRSDGSAQELLDVLRAVTDGPIPSIEDVEALAHERRGLTRTIAEGLTRRARETSIAVIVDDAHEADDALVDALELATLEGEGVALWVVVIALPRFTELRPQWGRRSTYARLAQLTPLSLDDASSLAAELLKPAEYPPAALLRRLALWSGGNAECLVEIVRTLKRAGVVRARPGKRSAYVAIEELDALTASPARKWLAARTLDALPPDLSAFARLAAVLGPTLDPREIEWVQDALDREGGASAPIDAAFGIDALVERGIVRPAKRGLFTFLSKVSSDALADLVDPSQRLAIHHHALAFRRARIDDEGPEIDHLTALAAHARACQLLDEAASAHAALADIALAGHAYVEADLGYAAALAIDSGPRRRARALLGRARCLYRLHHAREAVAALVEARALAEALGEEVLATEILLEEATALDWAEDFTASAERVEQAKALAERAREPWLTPRLLVAEARSLMRGGHMDAAVELLNRAMRAEGLDYDTTILGLVLLPVALVFMGRVDEAEARFSDALALARHSEDEPHICQILINRVVLWGMRGDRARALDDMSAALPVARALGNPYLERQVTINVASLLHWEGRQTEALALARRALMLDRRFLDPPHAEPLLLLARIFLAMEDDERAAQQLNEIPKGADASFSPPQQLFFDVLVRMLAERGVATHHVARATWSAIVAGARGNLVDAELLEVLYWYHRAASDAGRTEDANAAHEVALPLLENQTLWPRFGAQRSSWA